MIGNEIQFTALFVFRKDAATQNKFWSDIVNEVVRAAQTELDEQLRGFPSVKNWQDVENFDAASPELQLKKKLHEAVNRAIRPALNAANELIPGLHDKLGRHNFAFKNYEIMLREYSKDVFNSVVINFYFHSVECYLLAQFGKELLISFTDQPMSVSRNGRKQLNTFIVCLNQNITISKYVADDPRFSG